MCVSAKGHLQSMVAEGDAIMPDLAWLKQVLAPCTIFFKAPRVTSTLALFLRLWGPHNPRVAARISCEGGNAMRIANVQEPL